MSEKLNTNESLRISSSGELEKKLGALVEENEFLTKKNGEFETKISNYEKSINEKDELLEDMNNKLEDQITQKAEIMRQHEELKEEMSNRSDKDLLEMKNKIFDLEHTGVSSEAKTKIEQLEKNLKLGMK